MKIYIYVIYFPTSKRLNPHYVGITQNLEKRMLRHFNSKYQVGNALNKYDWIIKKLHTVKTYEEAFRIEIEEIRNFNCVAPNGYNLTRGGDGGDTFSGKHHTKETIEKMSQARQGRKHSKETIEKIKVARKKQIPPFQDKKHSKETIEKLKKVAKGKHWKWSEGQKLMGESGN